MRNPQPLSEADAKRLEKDEYGLWCPDCGAYACVSWGASIPGLETREQADKAAREMACYCEDPAGRQRDIDQHFRRFRGGE